jgi:hypothetical protein
MHMKNKPYATFKTSDGQINMTKDCLVRWLCLMEAFHIIEKKSETLGVNLDKKDWVKPLAFEKYIQQRFESMKLDMEIDEKTGIFNDIAAVDVNQPNLVVAPVS